jgi:hypothetical protein
MTEETTEMLIFLGVLCYICTLVFLLFVIG